MLSIRENRWLTALQMYVPLLRFLLLCAYSVVLFVQSSSAGLLDFPALLFILAIGTLGVSIAFTFEAYLRFFGGRTHRGFVANSRTLAIVRFRAPTLYIKRRDVLAVLDEGDSVRLRDGGIIRLARDFADDRRYRSEFRNPFHKQWGNQRPMLAGALRVEENT